MNSPEATRIIRRHGGSAPGHITVIEQFPTVHRINSKAEDPITVLKRLPEAVLWAWIREQLIARPKYVAKQVGIEQLAYLADLPKPVPSPTLAEVGELFWKKTISNNWMDKCKAFWQEFQEQVEVVTLREITQEHLIDYEEMVAGAMHEGRHTSTYARQRYQGVKSIINYPPKRGKWAEDCKRVKSFCAVLIPPPKSAIAQTQFSPSQWCSTIVTSNAAFTRLG